MTEERKSQLCNCRFCGKPAVVMPESKAEWEEDHRCGVRITCAGCGDVDVWAMRRKGETYKTLRKTATERWNALMETKKEKTE